MTFLSSRLRLSLGPQPDAIKKADGTFWIASSGGDSAFDCLYNPNANCYFFTQVRAQKRWWGVLFKVTSNVWEFRDPDLFDIYPTSSSL